MTLRGRTFLASCGHCPDCYARRADYYSRLCCVNSAAHKYNYFFTLTFNDQCVPRAFYHIENEHTIKFYDCTDRPLKPAKDGTLRTKCIDEYGDLVAFYSCKSLDLDNFRAFAEKSCRSYKYGLDNPFYQNNIIRYLRKKDCQNFFKRFRRHISRLYDIPIYYFAAGEYGPQSFRPHIHVFLSFDDDRLVPDLERLLHKSWKFGNIDGPEVARSINGVSSYVAGYLNSFTKLPCYLAVDGFRPFTLHSQNYGTAIDSYFRDECYSDVKKAAGQFDLPTPYGVWTYYPNSRCQGRIFPRCYNYDEQMAGGKYQLYTCYSHFRKLFPHLRTVSELTRRVLRSPECFASFLKHLDLYPLCSRDFPERSADCPSIPYRIPQGVAFKPVSEMTDHESVVYTRLYSAINMSRHFQDFCCKDRTPDEVIRIIDSYYGYYSPLVKLCQQLTAEQQWYDENFDTDYFFFYPYSEKPDDDCDLSYCSRYFRSKIMKRYNREKDLIYAGRVKHKELNDANDMFVNP